MTALAAEIVSSGLSVEPADVGTVDASEPVIPGLDPVGGGEVSDPVGGGAVSDPVGGGEVSDPVGGGAVSDPVGGGEVVAPAIVVAPATRLERIKTIGVKSVHFIIWDTSGRDGKEGGSDRDSRMSQAVQDTDHCSLWSTERVLWWWCASHLRKRRMVFLAERARCPSYFLLCH